ncbi:MAG: exodeoxyribonuclease VII large subunit [Bacteroidales bacterium]|nr:exodeoxyribonuclease VII large subunit [Bacteroidales bacterium]
MPQKKIYSLYEVTNSIERLFKKYYATRYFWIKVEIVRLNHYTHSGHCYPDLVDKKNGKTIAEIRGNIWRRDFQRINHKFRSVLNEKLNDNMTVVVYASVNYHSQYGLSLNIKDIDPEYTLGELARNKAESIRKLKAEGIFESNKNTTLSKIPKVIAIISVNTSKGYNDFINVIDKNKSGYQFHYKLFPAILQGEKAIYTIKAQLKHIRKFQDLFDAVAIIRGGGGDVGLSSYDSYELAKEIACFPLPVLSGIGHSINETVTDLVSFKSFITPTSIAEFLLQQFNDYAIAVNKTSDELLNLSEQVIRDEKQNLKEIQTRLQTTGYIIRMEMQNIRSAANKIYQHAKSIILEHKQKHSYISGKIDVLQPEYALKRGYSITRRNGEIIKSITEVKNDDKAEIQIADGIIKTRITEISKNK